MTVDKYPTKLEGVSGTTEKTAPCTSLSNKRSCLGALKAVWPTALRSHHLLISCILTQLRNGRAPETDAVMSPGDSADKDVRNLKHGSNEDSGKTFATWDWAFLSVF